MEQYYQSSRRKIWPQIITWISFYSYFFNKLQERDAHKIAYSLLSNPKLEVPSILFLDDVWGLSKIEKDVQCLVFPQNPWS